MSALALLKLIMHATRGGRIEVMGLMQGRIEGDCIIVLDSFALPVEGTETRVNAGTEAIEYMAQYTEMSAAVGRMENVVGWYHSHPGYGCWLSGIDVNTQLNNQKYQDPFIAVVVDPVRTVSSGKVEIGAFRTYPEGYKPPHSKDSEYQSIPMNKIEDFGVHAEMYYKVDVEFFKSSSDNTYLNLLWNKYWINTLSSSPLVNNREYTNQQISDLANKMEKVESEIGKSAQFGKHHMLHAETGSKKEKKEEGALAKINKDSVKLGVEILNNVISEVVKDSLFNSKPKLQ
jgi:COP9 signalosome complex subunit 5